MLQAASTHLLIPELSEDLIAASEPWPIDIYADGLMDELFADIDQILDAKGNFTSQTVNVEYVPLQTLKTPQIVLPKTLLENAQEVSSVKNKPLNQGMVDARNVKKVRKQRQHSKRVWTRVLIVGTTICIAIAGVIYLIKSEALHHLNLKLTQVSLPVSQPQLLKKVDVEAELVNYMLGALAIIDKQEMSQKSTKSGLTAIGNSRPTAIALANNQTIDTLPPPLTANNTPAVSNRPTIIERIYIPVYQAPSPMRYTPPIKPVAQLGARASRSDVVNSALNNLPKPAKPAGVNIFAAAVRPELKPATPLRTAQVAAGGTANLLPVLPVVPFRAAPPQLPVAKAPAPPTATQELASLPTSAEAAPSHILEGLLELGDKSAALFKIEGVTHRINVGENIGSSGWTLVEVNNGEAVVRRNGEVRSIFTGHKL
nr:hypothetical protein [Fortiea contorta]